MLSSSESGERRRFLKLLALVGLSAAVDAPAAIAQATRTGRSRVSTPATPATPDSTAVPPPPPGPSEDARALAAIVERRYGKHLTAVQLGKVTEELESRLQAGRRLRDVRLANGEEPDTVFRA